MWEQVRCYLGVMNRSSRTFLARAWFLALFLCSGLTLFLVATSLSNSNDSVDQAVWSKHRDDCEKIPEAAYTRDRFRSIRGRVVDELGNPLNGAVVRCSNLSAFVQLAGSSDAPPSKWTVQIEAEARTDPYGKYEFTHLPIGAYTFFYSAPGRAPEVRESIVVQDGLGAVIDVALERSATLTIRAEGLSKSFTRLTIVPSRWWPELPGTTIEPGGIAVFSSLGGSLRRGVIVATADEHPSAWSVVGRFDLDESSDVSTASSALPASIADLPEAASLESWNHPPGSGARLFFASLSPIALLWPQIAERPAPISVLIKSKPKAMASVHTGAIRGFGMQPFLPVLVESRAGRSWLGWTSDASEFEFVGLPGESLRVRSLDLFGRVSFARGVNSAAGKTSKLSDGIWTNLELDEPDSREIMGFVRWEDGRPAAGSAVFVQNSKNFRLFVRRVVADDNGFFRVTKVPGDEPYFAFALPQDEENAMREMYYFSVPASRREAWLDLVLHPHRISGRMGATYGERAMELVRLNSGGERVVFAFSTDFAGRFTIVNVPHGRYLVRTTGDGHSSPVRSSLINVEEGRTEEVVHWQ